MILIRTIIEIAGFPKEHVADIMEKAIKMIRDNKDIKIKKLAIAPVEEVKKLFSTFAEMDLEFSNLAMLNNFCFDFLPSSIEIIEPDKIQLDNKDLEDFLNDLLARLHQYDSVLRNLDAQYKILKNKLEPNSEK